MSGCSLDLDLCRTEYPMPHCAFDIHVLNSRERNCSSFSPNESAGDHESIAINEKSRAEVMQDRPNQRNGAHQCDGPANNQGLRVTLRLTSRKENSRKWKRKTPNRGDKVNAEIDNDRRGMQAMRRVKHAQPALRRACFGVPRLPQVSIPELHPRFREHRQRKDERGQGRIYAQLAPK